MTIVSNLPFETDLFRKRAIQILGENGIVHGPEERRLLIANYSIGDRILEGTLPLIKHRFQNAEILGPTDAEKISGYLGFGYLCGQYMNLLFGNRQANSEELARAAAYLNAGAALFDDVCDEEPASLMKLLQIVSRNSLEESLSGKVLSGEMQNAHKTNMTLALIFYDEFMKAHRSSAAFISRNEIFQELKDNLVQSYEAEIFSASKANFDSSSPSSEIEENLKLASANLVWCLAISAYLHRPVQSLAELRGYYDHVMTLGRIIWIVDDIVDVIKDLKDGKWSYVSIMASNLGVQIPGEERDVIQQLVDNDVIGKCTLDLSRNIHKFENGMAGFLTKADEIERIRRSLRGAIFAWLGVT